jgi:hypothetical protein
MPRKQPVMDSGIGVDLEPLPAPEEARGETMSDAEAKTLLREFGITQEKTA